jgi:mgtE-like transporter
VVAAVCLVAALAAAVQALRSELPTVRRVARESLPVLLLAGTADVVAGVAIENRLATFAAFPALLVLVPPFLEDSGALGGILAARLGSKLNLGLLDPRDFRWRAIADDITLVYVFAVAVFLLVGLSTDVVSAAAHLASPGVLAVTEIALLAGALATTAAVLVATGAALATYRFGFDPDNHGIPLVTSALDVLGAGALIVAMVLVVK